MLRTTADAIAHRVHTIITSCTLFVPLCNLEGVGLAWNVSNAVQVSCLQPYVVVVPTSNFSRMHCSAARYQFELMNQSTRLKE
jgi:hypothetical protein